ncbi:MAG: A/G-specific adenine glycosylase [Clostridia bacterium]|nr:A/G-specific adenine glycosylase [Clostridia bacterium]
MQKRLLAWYDGAKRSFPWRETTDPYAVWVSEVMLQQTRAETVIGYYTRFMKRFPSVGVLAQADEQDVLKAWEGLGYYSRARGMRKCAELIVKGYSGVFPKDVDVLRKLPGIGAYTAGAVASIAFGVRTPAVDGNVERVVSRLCGIRDDVGVPSVKRRIRSEAEAMMPRERCGDFNQAMMELGARICQPAPRCELCPVRQFCDASLAGDADALPVKQRKAPQRVVVRTVMLVFHERAVLLHRRDEKLLHGLWCFPGFDRLQTPAEAVKRLEELRIHAVYAETIGSARHTFTHIIWEMTLMVFRAASRSAPDGWIWADLAALASLPLPTATKAAQRAAEQILKLGAYDSLQPD